MQNILLAIKQKLKRDLKIIIITGHIYIFCKRALDNAQIKYSQTNKGLGFHKSRPHQALQ